jgi:HNH endonuclease
VFEEQHSICTICGHEHKLTAHHKIRRSKGGPDHPWNLVGICRPCHDGIHGFGMGCRDEADGAAAAIACAAHWNIVLDYLEYQGRLEYYNNCLRRTGTIGREAAARARRDSEESSHFAYLLARAIDESDSICT